jgi:hypothetical protein
MLLLLQGPPAVRPTVTRPPTPLPTVREVPNERVDPPTLPRKPPGPGKQPDTNLANRMVRKQREMLASAKTCQQCQQTCASFSGRMVDANPLTGLPRTCLSPMQAIKNCLELCEVTVPRVWMEG